MKCGRGAKQNEEVPLCPVFQDPQTSSVSFILARERICSIVVVVDL